MLVSTFFNFSPMKRYMSHHFVILLWLQFCESFNIYSTPKIRTHCEKQYLYGISTISAVLLYMWTVVLIRLFDEFHEYKNVTLTFFKCNIYNCNICITLRRIYMVMILCTSIVGKKHNQCFFSIVCQSFTCKLILGL